MHPLLGPLDDYPWGCPDPFSARVELVVEAEPALSENAIRRAHGALLDRLCYFKARNVQRMARQRGIELPSVLGRLRTLAVSVPAGTLFVLDFGTSWNEILQQGASIGYWCVVAAGFVGDGFGDPEASVDGCDEPNGFVADATDCDDTDADSHPGASEVWYDGIDEACDGGSDNDQDGDGYDAVSTGGDDCDDTMADVHPGADDPVNGVDANCDGYDDSVGTVTAGGCGCTHKGLTSPILGWLIAACLAVVRRRLPTRDPEGSSTPSATGTGANFRSPGYPLPRSSA